MFNRTGNTYEDLRFELRPDLFIPLRVHQESRTGYRASVGKKQLIFRIPRYLSKEQRADILAKLSEWTRNTFAQQPQSFAHLLPKKIPTQGRVTVMEKEFRVQLMPGNGRKSHLARFAETDPSLIYVELAYEPESPKKGSVVETLISRLSSQLFLPVVTKRVDELNDAYFQQDISGVTLKLTKSQWGSCSSKGNINLSSRLLLVPEPVRDSVIIHELAHRIEMNHSDRFWKLVYDAMPDYDQHHTYLTRHGKSLSFLPV